MQAILIPLQSRKVSDCSAIMSVPSGRPAATWQCGEQRKTEQMKLSPTLTQWANTKEWKLLCGDPKQKKKQAFQGMPTVKLVVSNHIRPAFWRDHFPSYDTHKRTLPARMQPTSGR